MCSVGDVDKTLQEIRRVLKPGGVYCFVDHVAAQQGEQPTLARAQQLVNPAWGVCADGCNVTRDVLGAIENAGFSSVNGERFGIDVPLLLRIVSPHVRGVAVK